MGFAGSNAAVPRQLDADLVPFFPSRVRRFRADQTQNGALGATPNQLAGKFLESTWPRVHGCTYDRMVVMTDILFSLTPPCPTLPRPMACAGRWREAAAQEHSHLLFEPFLRGGGDRRTAAAPHPHHDSDGGQAARVIWGIRRERKRLGFCVLGSKGVVGGAFIARLESYSLVYTRWCMQSFDGRFWRTEVSKYCTTNF